MKGTDDFSGKFFRKQLGFLLKEWVQIVYDAEISYEKYPLIYVQPTFILYIFYYMKTNV